MPEPVVAVDRWAVPEPAPPAPAVRPVVTHNPLGVDPDVLFGVARRRNPKRSALFVSKVLAKHIPVEASRAILSGLLLGREVAEVLGAPPAEASRRAGAAALADPREAAALVAELRAERVDPGPVLVLGFAETATSLGHLVRDALGPRARGILTTRVHEVAYPPLARFEEEHSHATAHRIVHDDPAVLLGGEPLVLVDDELTTGRTVLNTIAALHQKAPRDRYVVAGLLDWRDAEARAAFAETAERLGVAIDVVSLVAGRVEGDLVDDQPVLPDDGPVGGARPGAGDLRVTRTEVRIRRAGGRHGWDPAHQRDLDADLDVLASAVERLGVGTRTLCLGTEELMYLPMRLAEHLGPEVRVQSTTRSPVIAADVDGYPIRHRRAFAHPGDPDRPSYLYNLPAGAYDDVVVLVDPAAAGADDTALAEALSGGGSRLHLLHLVETS